MHDPGLSCICIYIHPQVLTLIASVYLNVLLIARFAWCTVAVSSLLVNFLRGIFGTVFPFHFRNFSENSSFSVTHSYSYSRFFRFSCRELELGRSWFWIIVGTSVSKDSTPDSFSFLEYSEIMVDFEFWWIFWNVVDHLSGLSIMFYLCLLYRLGKKELSIDFQFRWIQFFPTILKNEIECLLVSNY